MWALRRFEKKKNKKTTTHKINKNNQQKNNNNNNKKQAKNKTYKAKVGTCKKIKTADKVIQRQGDTQMKLKSSNNRENLKHLNKWHIFYQGHRKLPKSEEAT